MHYPQIQTTPAFPKWASLILKWALGTFFSFSKKTVKWAFWQRNFSFERPAKGRKGSLNMKGGSFEKMNFCNVHLSLDEKTYCEQHAFLVDPLGFLIVCCSFPHPCFFDRKKRRHKLRKKGHLVSPCSKFGSQNFPKGPHDPRSGSPRRPFRVLEGAQRSHPVLSAVETPLTTYWTVCRRCKLKSRKS